VRIDTGKMSSAKTTVRGGVTSERTKKKKSLDPSSPSLRS
jgi:hypothetical protein